ncbi:MAG: hypothetical protein Q9220_000725 [cf. Caloplaca sp. 1 TL-2023]
MAEPVEDPMTGEQISSTTIPKSLTSKSDVTELRSPSKKASVNHSTPKAAHAADTYSRRAGLGAYTQAPESFPSSRVIQYDDKYVTINDMFPKSSIHLLLLPRHPEMQLLHPFEALQDPSFLSDIQSQVRNLKALAAKELQRRFGKVSAQERKREEAIEKAMESGEEFDEIAIPAGRDWDKDIVAGVHTHPSMTHLHIHILSVDRYNECMRHRKHYNSFATPFLVDVEDFPLSKDDMKYQLKEKFLERDLICWRCGKNFGNQFAKLKHHLDGEFEEWKKQ